MASAKLPPGSNNPELRDVRAHPVKTVTEHCKILGVLGYGKFSTVYRAWDLKREQHIAMKVLKRDTIVGQELYVNEVKMHSRITRERDLQKDSNCVGFICSFIHNDYSWICMDLCGPNLMTYRMRCAELGLPIRDVRYILKDILKGVAFLHSIGIIHTDLKPGNIVLSQNSLSTQLGIGCVKIVDFGNAVFKDCQSRHIVSTPSYRAIEVWLGIPWDSKIDMWSIGCIALELFTGQILLDTNHAHSYLRWTEHLLQQRIPESMRKVWNRHYFKWNGSVNYCDECPPTPTMAQLSDLSLCDSDSKILASFQKLCLSLLNMDQSTRISAEDALNQEFFTGISEIAGENDEEQEA